MFAEVKSRWTATRPVLQAARALPSHSLLLPACEVCTYDWAHGPAMLSQHDPIPPAPTALKQNAATENCPGQKQACELAA